MKEEKKMRNASLFVAAVLMAGFVRAEVADSSSESAFAVVGRAGEAGVAEMAKALEAKIAAREGRPCRPVATLALPTDDAAARKSVFDYGGQIKKDAGVRRIGMLATPAAYCFVTNVFAYNFKHGAAQTYPLSPSCRADILELPAGAELTEDVMNHVCGYRVDLDRPLCAFMNGDAPLVPAEAVAAMDAGSWIDEPMAKTRKRLDAWRGKDEVVVVAFTCDLHVYSPAYGRWPSREALTGGNLRTLKRFTYVANRFGCDAAADLGDMGYDYSRRHWMLSCLSERTPRIALQQACYDLVDVPFVVVPGNHDGHWKTMSAFGETFNPSTAKRTQNFVFGPTRAYGYFDIPGKRTRLFFINTSEGKSGGCGGGNVISAAQIDFLRNAVKTTPDGWTTAFFGHECVHQTAGNEKWVERPWKRQQGYCDMRALLESIASEGRLKLAGIWCGDSHMNRLHEEKGVKYFICDAAFSGKGEKNLLVHLAAINPRTGEGRLFRVGARDKKGDL